VLVPADTVETNQVLSSECFSSSETLVNCPAGMVGIGYQARSGAWMDQFSLICATLELDGSLSGVGYSGFIGTSSGPILNTSGCPAGQLLVGMLAKYGDKIDSIQGRCHPASEIVSGGAEFTQLAPLLGSGGGSSTTTQQCPSGYAITGAYGRTTGAYPCGVRWLCTRVVLQ
jgi:hypothetical protein